MDAASGAIEPEGRGDEVRFFVQCGGFTIKCLHEGDDQGGERGCWSPTFWGSRINIRLVEEQILQVLYKVHSVFGEACGSQLWNIFHVRRRRSVLDKLVNYYYLFTSKIALKRVQEETSTSFLEKSTRRQVPE